MSAFNRLVPGILFGLLVGTVTAIAQPDTTGSADVSASGGVTAGVTATASVSLSASEMTSRSEAIEAQMQDDYRHVLSLKDKARKLKDVIKLNCVNDKLVQIKAQMNIAGTAQQSMQGALGQDLTRANELFVQVESIGRSVKELREQANGCIGEPELNKEDLPLEVTRPDLVDDPGIQDPYTPDGAVMEPPGYASPFN